MVTGWRAGGARHGSGRADACAGGQGRGGERAGGADRWPGRIWSPRGANPRTRGCPAHRALPPAPERVEGPSSRPGGAGRVARPDEARTRCRSRGLTRSSRVSRYAALRRPGGRPGIAVARPVTPYRGVAQPGRALGSGPRGRRFKSCLPDSTARHRKEFAVTGICVSGVRGALQPRAQPPDGPEVARPRAPSAGPELGSQGDPDEREMDFGSPRRSRSAEARVTPSPARREARARAPG